MNKKFLTDKKSPKTSQTEIKIYGENACLAVYKVRPQDIIQLFFTKEKLKENPKLTRELTSFMAKNKKAYHQVTREELTKMTKATHHEDLVMLIRKKKEVTLEDFLKKNARNPGLLLVLEDVSNPHNVGAILRTAAHFGVKGIILSSAQLAETGSAIRVSEGGLEFVHVFSTENISHTLKLLLDHNYQIITTSSHAKKSLNALKWNPQSVVVFGEEANGLSPEILKSGECIKIPGTDHVESLNVSVASSILMYDYFQKLRN